MLTAFRLGRTFLSSQPQISKTFAQRTNTAFSRTFSTQSGNGNSNFFDKFKRVLNNRENRILIGFLTGFVGYMANEHLRRRQHLIDQSKATLGALHFAYQESSKKAHEIELKLANSYKEKGKLTNLDLKDDNKLGIVYLAEMEYRSTYASDSRLSCINLRKEIEDNFNDLVKHIFSPEFDSDLTLQKQAVIHFFMVHQLIIVYEKSLAEFNTNSNSFPYLMNFPYIGSLQQLHRSQEEGIKEANDTVAKDIANKTPEEVFEEITPLFRRGHYYTPKATAPTPSPVDNQKKTLPAAPTLTPPPPQQNTVKQNNS